MAEMAESAEPIDRLVDETWVKELGLTPEEAIGAQPHYEAAVDECCRFLAAHGGQLQARLERFHAAATDLDALRARSSEVDDAIAALYARAPHQKDFQCLEEWWVAHLSFEVAAAPLADELCDIDRRLTELRGD